MTRSNTLVASGLATMLVSLAGGAMAANSFNGPYFGYERETKTNNSGHCQNLNRDNLHVTVRDGTIKWTWGGVPLVATIASDGSFSTTAAGWASRGASGSFSFNGRTTGGSLEADVGSIQCAAHLSMKKV
jgi:hypothetical protein